MLRLVLSILCPTSITISFVCLCCLCTCYSEYKLTHVLMYVYVEVHSFSFIVFQVSVQVCWFLIPAQASALWHLGSKFRLAICKLWIKAPCSSQQEESAFNIRNHFLKCLCESSDWLRWANWTATTWSWSDWSKSREYASGSPDQCFRLVFGVQPGTLRQNLQKPNIISQ